MNIKHAYIFIGGIPIMRNFNSLSLSLSLSSNLQNNWGDTILCQGRI